jgi:hypothetical protein
VDSAAVGDTVLVGAGVHSDTSHVFVLGAVRPVNVVLDKNITLLGESSPAEVTIDAASSEIAVYATNVDSTARVERIGFVGDFFGAGCPASQESGARADVLDRGISCLSASPTIVDNEFRNIETGVFLDGSTSAITGSLFSELHEGVWTSASPGVVVSGCEFVDCSVGVTASYSISVLSSVFTSDPIYPASCTAIEFGSGGPATIVGNRIEGMENYAILGSASNAVIRQNRIRDSTWGVNLGSPGAVVAENTFTGNVTCLEFLISADVSVESNTFEGGAAIVLQGSSGSIRNNIIVNASVGIWCFAGSNATVECNDVFGTTTPYWEECPDMTGIAGNIAVDPEFCGVAGTGDYRLQSDSPCALGNHPEGMDCGQIGAFGVDCGEVEVKTKSWGALKALYHDEGDGR